MSAIAKSPKSETHTAALARVNELKAKVATEREAELIAAVRMMDIAHQDWVRDSGRHEIDIYYQDMIEAMLSVFERDDIPGRCRNLADASTEFSKQWVYFLQNRGETLRDPQNEMWSARERLVELAKPQEARRLREIESIESLMKLVPPPNPLQVAKIWGIVDRNGEYSAMYASMEIDKPGSITKTPGAMDGRDWEHPDLVAERKRQRVSQPEQPPEQPPEIDEPRRKPRKPRKPCPETPYQLWVQKVSVEQSAKMLVLEVAEVKEMFEVFESGRDASEVEEPANEAELTGIDAETAQIIREYAKDGLSAEEIAVEVNQPAEAVQGIVEGVEKKKNRGKK